MDDLIRQEIFELEVLDALNSSSLLNSFAFCGGTMLRLCHGLNRYSVDLDFWADRENDFREADGKLTACIKRKYEITDHAVKRNTLLFEFKSIHFPRKLKIEIRRIEKKVAFEHTIAYSPHAAVQVLTRSITLKEAMRSKVEAFIARKEIRDAFDIEFLVKKGIELPAELGVLEKVAEGIEAFKKTDYTVKLGSVLDAKLRSYYKNKNFEVLLTKVKECIG